MARLKVTEPIKGAISLVGATVCRSRSELPEGVAVSGASPTHHEIFVVANNRTLHLNSQSALDADGWFNYLTRAVAGHSSHDGAKIRSASSPRATIAAAVSAGMKARLLPAPIAVSAWVHKMAPDGHRWERRWASLKPDSLVFAYYTGPGAGDRCCRVVDLRAATLRPGCADASDPRADPTLRRSSGFRVVVHGVGTSSDRELVFVTPDDREAQTWVDAIHTAQHVGGASKGTGVGSRRRLGDGSASASGGAGSPRDGKPASGASAAAAAAGAPVHAADAPVTLADLPVKEGHVFKANPAGTKWQTRQLVLVPHASKLASAPGVPADACPCIAYYPAGSRGSGPKGKIALTEVTGVVMTAPDKVRRSAPGAFTLTIQTEEREYYLSARSEADLVAWRDSIYHVAEVWNNEDDEE
jgi:hypothetical protein